MTTDNELQQFCIRLNQLAYGGDFQRIDEIVLDIVNGELTEENDMLVVFITALRYTFMMRSKMSKWFEARDIMYEKILRLEGKQKCDDIMRGLMISE